MSWIAGSAITLLALSLLANAKTRGHMPGSGYAEERFWRRVSSGLFLLACIPIGLLVGFAMR